MTVRIPHKVIPTSYAAKYSFETPLSLPTFGEKMKEEVKDDQKETPDAAMVDEEVENPVHVTFNAGIAGSIAHRRQRAKAQFEDGTEEEMNVSLTLTSYRSLHSVLIHSRSPCLQFWLPII